MKSHFHLEKWYMDVVTENAEVFIGYHARLKWKNFYLIYSGFIQRKNNGAVIIKNSLGKSDPPEWNGSRLHWAQSFLRGEWNAMDAPIEMNLLRNEDRLIEWNCMMPKGTGNVILGDVAIAGLGYAEKMTLNILPWQLPIKELFWGRFLSKDYALIWIEWRGPQPKLCIWVNGTLYTSGSVSNEGIQMDHLSLSFESKLELRAGRIGETIFKGIRKIMSIFPKSIFQLNENKWCGVANLTLADRQQIKGTYIHEHVIWP